MYFRTSTDVDGDLIIESRNDDGTLQAAIIPLRIVTSPDYGTPEDLDADNRYLLVGTDDGGGFEVGQGVTETN